MFRLKQHPFPVLAHFERSIVLTFAVPKENLESKFPAPFVLDTFKEHGFVAVAFVRTKRLRPKGFPAFLGMDFQLVGYRIFVKYRNKEGRNRRGLFILKSETDQRKMKWLGNRMTHYNYDYVPMEFVSFDTSEYVKSTRLHLDVEFSEENVPLPEGSIFENWKEARRFAGPMPFTFTKDHQKVIVVKGKRKGWEPSPVQINSFSCHFIEEQFGEEVKLASAFHVKQIDYEWAKGIVEPC